MLFIFDHNSVHGFIQTAAVGDATPSMRVFVFKKFKCNAFGFSA